MATLDQCSTGAMALSPPGQPCDATVMLAMTTCLTAFGWSGLTVYDAFNFPFNKKFIDFSVSSVTESNVENYFSMTGEAYDLRVRITPQFECSCGDYDGIYQLLTGFLYVAGKLSSDIYAPGFIAAIQCAFRQGISGGHPDYANYTRDNSYLIAYSEWLNTFIENVQNNCSEPQADLLRSFMTDKDMSFVQHIANSSCYTTISTPPSVLKDRCRKRLHRYRHPRKCTWKSLNRGRGQRKG